MYMMRNVAILGNNVTHFVVALANATANAI